MRRIAFFLIFAAASVAADSLGSDIIIATRGASPFPELPLDEFTPHISIPLPAGADKYGGSAAPDTAGFQDTASELLSLHLLQDGKPATGEVYSTYRLHADRLVLIPLSPLVPEADFVVQSKLRDRTLTAQFSTPKYRPTDQPPAELVQWYPLGPLIPENTLMFYGLLNVPIKLNSRSMRFVDMLDEDGSNLGRVWTSYPLNSLENSHETLFPMMIHPGRIKIGAAPRETLGPVMREGNSYTIHLRREGFTDVHYRPMPKDARKTYVAGPADAVLPVFDAHQSEPPRAHSQDPLLLVFSESMDYNSIRGGILVYPSSERDNPEPPSLGMSEITHDESDNRWLLTPETEWEDVPYTVEFTEFVTDLAHNSLRVPFEAPSVDQLYKHRSDYWEFIPRR